MVIAKEKNNAWIGFPNYSIEIRVIQMPLTDGFTNIKSELKVDAREVISIGNHMIFE